MNKSVSLIRLYAGVLSVLVVTFTGCIFFAGSDTGIAVPNLTVKGAPSDITALSLRVTGPGMAPVESYYSSVPSSITIEVPAGVDRQFELIAYIGPSNPSAATSFKGTATVDLSAGKTKNITLNMIVNETKLLIPDPSWPRYRLVQIDDIAGSGWIEKIESGFSPAPNGFVPYDIDFDSQGRIYIANHVSSAGGHKVMRIDNMNTDSYDIIVSDSGAGGGSIVAITIDRANNVIYYLTNSDLYKKNIDGGAEVDLTVAAEADFKGLAIDDNGIIYIANAGSNEVIKYNPQTQTVIKQVVLGTEPRDVMVKSPYIYVARYEHAGVNQKIIKLTQNLDFVDELPGKPDSTDDFRGPHRFVAILNKRIYIIDEDETMGSGDIERIVAIDDINGNNWDTFDPSMLVPAESSFAFYGQC